MQQKACFFLLVSNHQVHVQVKVLFSKYYLILLSNEDIKGLLFDFFQHYIGYL